jgi:hypothetical protein
MEAIDQRYLVQQNKRTDDGKAAPVFARVMRSKEGKFEGVSFIKNKEKATVMTSAEAQEVVTWAAKKKENAQQCGPVAACRFLLGLSVLTGRGRPETDVAVTSV